MKPPVLSTYTRKDRKVVRPILRWIPLLHAAPCAPEVMPSVSVFPKASDVVFL